MASRRMISSDIFEDEFFCELTHAERLLWIGIIAQCADDQGRLQDRPNTINLRIFPEDGLQPEIICDGLDKFYQAGKIARYTKSGKNLIQIIKWWVYQTPSWAAPSKFPAPDNWIDKVRIHIPGNKIHLENWDKAGGYVAGCVPMLPTQLPSYVPTTLSTGIEDVKSEVNVKSEGEVEVLPPLPNAYTIYENNIGQSTPFIADGIDNWLNTYPAEWIPAAIEEAVKNSARNFKYCDAILKRWAVEGFKSEKKPTGKKSNAEANIDLMNKLLEEN